MEDSWLILEYATGVPYSYILYSSRQSLPSGPDSYIENMNNIKGLDKNVSMYMTIACTNAGEPCTHIVGSHILCKTD